MGDADDGEKDKLEAFAAYADADVDRDADADDHDDGEEADVLLCGIAKHPVVFVDFQSVGFCFSQRIKELFEQLDISTEDVRKRARRLFKLIDENLGVDLV